MPDQQQMIEQDRAQAEELGQARQQAVAAAAPEAAEPLDPGSLERLSVAIDRAAGALAGGQIPPEASKFEVPPEPVPAMPGDMFVLFSALGAGLGEAARLGVTQAEPYAYDPVESASSNDGLEEATAALMAASEDSDLIRALQQPPPTGEEPAGAEEGEEPAEEKPPAKREDML